MKTKLRRKQFYISCIFFCLFSLGISIHSIDALAASKEPKSISNDEYSDTQWTLNNTGVFRYYAPSGKTVVSSTTDIDIDIPEAWDKLESKEFGKRTVTVALIDTGVDSEHEDLKNVLWTNKKEIPGDGIDNDENGYVDDIHGWDFYNDDSSICHYSTDKETGNRIADPNDCDDHGTHCAGIIAAVKDNKKGIAGVASPIKVKIMSLKIHGGAKRNGTISSAIKAIKYADMMGADICNLSWGSYTYSEALYSAIKESNMLFICAAGNDGVNNNQTPLYPASFNLPNVISVGYTNADGELAKKSNYGDKTVDLAVPSVNVCSTIVGGYDYMNGSSMAAPHVTGIAAMLYSYGNNISAPNIKEIILNSVKKLPSLTGKVSTGGIASASLALSGASAIISDTTKPTLSVTRTFDKGDVVLNINARDNLSGVHNIRYFIGTKTITDFNGGLIGTIVEGDKLHLSKAGYYTFYVDDYAGNKLVKIIYASDDTTVPTITDVSYKVSNDYKTITVSGVATDDLSDIKTLKFLEGALTTRDFSSSGTAVKLKKNGKFSFKLSEEGPCTIFASDYRGNRMVSINDFLIIRSTALSLSRAKKTLKVGKTMTLDYTVSPSNTTDVVKFKSSSKKIATVDKNGVITAVGKGKCKITVTTSSGLTAVLKLTVKN